MIFVIFVIFEICRYPFKQQQIEDVLNWSLANDTPLVDEYAYLKDKVGFILHRVTNAFVHYHGLIGPLFPWPFIFQSTFVEKHHQHVLEAERENPGLPSQSAGANVLEFSRPIWGDCVAVREWQNIGRYVFGGGCFGQGWLFMVMVVYGDG